MQDYKLFEEDDFINDEYFQNWVFGHCKFEDKEFWEAFIRLHPEKKDTIEQAIFALQKIFEEEEMKGFLPSDEKVETSFQEIRQLLGLGKKEKAPIISLRRLGWAAASVAIIIAGFWIIRNSRSGDIDNSEKLVVNHSNESLHPGGNKAMLTLADGTNIILDSANNGQLADEGNAMVIKLDDGRLAYNGKNDNENKVLYNTMTTPAGGNYQITLSDGTVVWLNAKSSLRFPTAFSGSDRRVELDGEGYFEVKHDETRPFFVSVNGMDVKVLGTVFNIRAYRDDEAVRTTLLQGRVEVKAGNQSVVLKPGQQAVEENGKNALVVKSNVSVDEVVAWKNGYFQFDNVKLDEILKEVSRWYDANIVYENKVNDLFSGAMPRDRDIKNLLNVLELTEKVKFEIVGKQIIVKPK